MSVSKRVGQLVGKTINDYNKRTKPVIDELKFKERYQGRIIDCMVGEVDDNYIETPETNAFIVKLEHSKEGVVKVPSIKGKTVLVDIDGSPTDIVGEGCRFVSVGEDEDNKLVFLSKNKNIMLTWVRGFISSVDGNDGSGDKSIKTNFIPIMRESIYIKGLYDQVHSFVAFYDKDKKYIKRTSGTTRSEVMLVAKNNPNTDNNNEIPLNCAYIRLTQYVISGQSSTIEEIENHTKNAIVSYKDISYIEPKHHKAELQLQEPLRSLSNGVCDEITGNKLIRRIGVRPKIAAPIVGHAVVGKAIIK